MSRSAALSCLVFAALAAVAAPGAAEPRPAGGLFALSGCRTCQQHFPSVAGSEAGFLAVWEGADATVRQGVFGRPFDHSALPLAADFQVEKGAQQQPPPQYDAAAGVDAQGNYVVVWATIANDLSSIVAQRYTPAGAPAGQAVVVASDPASSPTIPADFKPAVAGTPDGGFAVAWMSLDPAGGATRVMERRYDASDQPTADAIQLNDDFPTGERPGICVSDTGRVIVAWTFADSFQPFQAGKSGVGVRRIYAGGTPIEEELVVAPPTAANSAAASVSCGKRNSFVVTWHSEQQPAVSGSDVLAQRYSRKAHAIGPTFVVNQKTAGDQKNPAIFHDAAGSFVIVWESTAQGAIGVFGRRYATNGDSLSDEFPVYTSTGEQVQLRPAIAAAGQDGGFVVVWDGASGLFGRRFTIAAQQ
ncbi:MAG TPA: hypothetical protein VHQ90_22585 [Thermoanaerobaculia bacterium]|nr:hypothetical protein [Thermoanaerobaculia bacterium]